MQLFKRNKLKQVKCRYLLGTKQLRAEVNKWLVRKRQAHFFFSSSFEGICFVSGKEC